jgi:cobaltochelatase CobT
VTLLIDHSGSMRGRPMQIAALTVEIFARVLERCGVKCEVLGFTTRDWDGGEPARQWAADGYPENPGRLNALEHIVIKSADVPWRRARIALGLFLHDEMLKENIDGEAVRWAHARLLARPERRKILVVVSDGTPMDEATFAANGFDYLDGHLVAVVEEIETRSPVKLAAIGIGHDVSRFYRNATRISRIDDLGPALTQKLIGLLGD